MEKCIRKTILVAILVIICCYIGCGKPEAESEKNITENNQEKKDKKDTSLEIGEISERRGTDVVFVMDESGSMVKSDKDRIAIEGAKLFIDMEKRVNANIALVEFSNETKSTGLIDMQQQQNREYIKSVLDGIVYSGTAHTDTGAGLLEAVSVLDGTEDKNEKCIILFTDGCTDIDAGTPERTTEDSKKDVGAAINQAKEKGYKIYCIGLNADGSVDEAELSKIASSTEGVCHVVTDVNELPGFFNSIFADIDQSDEMVLDEFDSDGNYRDVHFIIDNKNVMEANIVILSSQQVEDITLLDESGNPIDLINDEKVEFSRSSKYTLVKLIYPKEGEWVVSVKGVPSSHIKVGVIYNYDVTLLVKADKTEVDVGDEVNLTAYLASDRKRLKDKAFYKNMKGSIVGVNQENGEKIKGKLKLNEKGTALKGKLKITEDASYKVTVHVEGNGFYRDSKAFEVACTQKASIEAKEIPDIEVRMGDTETLDLSLYFTDSQGNALSYSVQGGDGIVSAEIKESVLKVTANKKGKAQLEINGENGLSINAQQTLQVQVVPIWGDVLKVAILPIAILLLLIVFLIRKKMEEKVTGVVRLTILSCKNDEYGVLNSQPYPILRSIPLRNVGVHGFTLQSLLKMAKGHYTAEEYNQERKEAFESCVRVMKPESAKVKIKGSRKNFQIKLINQSSLVKFVDMNTVTDRKKVVISLGEEQTGVRAADEREIGIRFIGSNEQYIQINMVYQKM